MWGPVGDDLLKPHVTHLVVCDPRKNALLKDGSKSDRIDARKLAELLGCGNQLTSVYHGEHGMRTFKGIRSQLRNHYAGSRSCHESNQSTLPKLGHSLQRYQRLCTARHRAEWLDKILEPGVRLLGRTALSATGSATAGASASATRRLTESRNHHAEKKHPQIPSIGPISAALLVAQLQTPHRFRTKRQLWAYSGFALKTHDSGEYRYVRGKLQRNQERMTVRGLNNNHNPDVKNLFKGGCDLR